MSLKHWYSKKNEEDTAGGSSSSLSLKTRLNWMIEELVENPIPTPDDASAARAYVASDCASLRGVVHDVIEANASVAFVIYLYRVDDDRGRGDEDASNHSADKSASAEVVQTAVPATESAASSVPVMIVARRYSDFRRLHLELANHFRMNDLPSIPPRSFLGAPNLAERTEHLKETIGLLLAKFGAHPLVRLFFALDEIDECASASVHAYDELMARLSACRPDADSVPTLRALSRDVHTRLLRTRGCERCLSTSTATSEQGAAGTGATLEENETEAFDTDAYAELLWCEQRLYVSLIACKQVNELARRDDFLKIRITERTHVKHATEIDDLFQL